MNSQFLQKGLFIFKIYRYSMNYKQDVNVNSTYKIVVYGGDYCPFCRKTKNLFKAKEVPFEYRDISQKKEFDQQRDELAQKLNFFTVPMVFINNKFYGGWSDISKLDQEGELDKLIK